MKKFAVIAFTFALSVIMIAQLSSALIVQSHSKKIHINKEDTLELGKNFPFKWFYRQVDLGSFQPIIGDYLPRIFKKTAVILPTPSHI